ncbi:MAG: tyrosine-type recombinase/integrase [Candidatus Aenigmarchaeota archaeon]|nr:tyrosine-type recombinase/integrase [Candidatus Aenigmarchaeota archaeon]
MSAVPGFGSVSSPYTRALKRLLDATTGERLVVYATFLQKTCVKDGLCERRKIKYIWLISKVNRVLGGRNNGPLSQDDVDAFFIWLQTAQYSEETKKDNWNLFRKFARSVNPKLDFREYKLRVGKKRKLPEEILTDDEVRQIKAVPNSVRNKALIGLLYETGCRTGELTNLRIKDILFDAYGAVIRLNGKTGMRRVRIVESVPVLALYLQEHRFHDSLDAYMFYRIDKNVNKQMSYTAICKIVKDASRRCGLQKRVYPYLFRHSRATHLAKHLTEQELKIYFGWVGDSKMAGTYVHLSGKDVEDKILQINGITPINTTGNSMLKTKHCVRCTMTNDSAATYCSRCGMVLDEKEAFKTKDVNPDAEFQTFLKEMYERWKDARKTFI